MSPFSSPGLAETIQMRKVCREAAAARDVDGRLFRTLLSDPFAAKDAETVQEIERWIGSGSPEMKEEIRLSELNEEGLLARAISARFPVSTLRLLVASGARVETPWRHGPNGSEIRTPPLHGALCYPQLDDAYRAEVLRFLLEAGVSPAHRSPYGRLPLELSMAGGGLKPRPKAQDPAWILLQAGADPNEKTSAAWRPDGSREDGYPVFFSCHTRHQMEWMLSHGANPRLRSENNETVLHVAGLEAEMVPLLVRKGANPNARDAQGRTPLHCQEEEGAILALLDAGANPALLDNDGRLASGVEALADKDLRCKTAMAERKQNQKRAKVLALAIEEGFVEKAMECLSSGADPNAFHEGKPLLIHAINAYPVVPEMVIALAHAGADLDQAIDTRQKWGFIHFLAATPSAHAPRLIQHFAHQCEMQALTIDGLTALGVAASSRPDKSVSVNGDYRLANCKALLASGVVPNEKDLFVSTNLALRSLIKATLRKAQSEPSRSPCKPGMPFSR